MLTAISLSNPYDKYDISVIKINSNSYSLKNENKEVDETFLG